MTMTPAVALARLRSICDEADHAIFGVAVLTTSEVREVLDAAGPEPGGGYEDDRTYVPDTDLPLPAVPGRGDRIRVLWNGMGRDGDETQWQDAILLRLDAAGFWWSPADDAPEAYWSPWRHVEQIAGGASA